MAKFFLLSIIIAMISIPTRAARAATAAEGLRRTLIHIATFYALYLVGLKFIFGRSGTVHLAYMIFIVLLLRFMEKRFERRNGKLAKPTRPAT